MKKQRRPRTKNPIKPNRPKHYAKTREREKAKRINAALTEYAANAPPIDYRASFDSLDLMEGVMRHFYLLALIEQRQDADTNWDKVNGLMRQVLDAAHQRGVPQACKNADSTTRAPIGAT